MRFTTRHRRRMTTTRPVLVLTQMCSVGSFSVWFPLRRLFTLMPEILVMTMIAQDPYDVASLEVLNAAGQWIKPKLEPHTFVVNLGDMMARLTNDVYLSTIHRVCNKTGRARYSLPFFFGLNNDELISPLPQFVSAKTPAREGYDTGMTAYEHYNRRMQRAHHKHPTATEKFEPRLPKGMTKIDGVVVEGL